MSFVVNQKEGKNLSIENDQLENMNKVYNDAVEFVLKTGSRFV